MRWFLCALITAMLGSFGVALAADRREQRHDARLTCGCLLPNVGPNDECLRCRRVIAERVHQRRAGRL
jgi:hypothetical protein